MYESAVIGAILRHSDGFGYLEQLLPLLGLPVGAALRQFVQDADHQTERQQQYKKLRRVKNRRQEKKRLKALKKSRKEQQELRAGIPLYKSSS